MREYYKSQRQRVPPNGLGADCRSSFLQALSRPRQQSANDYHFDHFRVAGHAGYGFTIARNVPSTLSAKADFAPHHRAQLRCP